MLELYRQSIIDILTQEDKTSISTQVELRNADTTDSAVIQGALEPLGGVSVQTVLGEVLQVTTERAKTLGAHGVSLVGLHIVSYCKDSMI